MHTPRLGALYAKYDLYHIYTHFHAYLNCMAIKKTNTYTKLAQNEYHKYASFKCTNEQMYVSLMFYGKHLISLSFEREETHERAKLEMRERGMKYRIRIYMSTNLYIVHIYILCGLSYRASTSSLPPLETMTTGELEAKDEKQLAN